MNSVKGRGARGRRPGTPHTRAQILASARRLFGEQGFHATSLRQVAAEAGVDVRLVGHYFGSKADLFVAAVDLPIDAGPLAELVLGPGVEGAGRRAAEFIATSLTTPGFATVMAGFLRAAGSDETAADVVRTLLRERVLRPLAERLDDPFAERRIALVGSQIGGLVLGRVVLGMPPLLELERDELVRALAPVIQHYLQAPLADDAVAGADLPASASDR